ncbi:MAG TPA: hemolysin family protein, partial [Oligoflexia bacterium]|nr:hemolysin family protein [Oligoflexia bacterium]
NLVLRLIGFAPAGQHHGVHSVDELGILVHQSHVAGVLDELETKILERTFHFSELSAGEIKTPRADIDALDLKKPMPELLDQLGKTFHTRIPVYEESIDQIVGIINVHDVFRALRQDGQIESLRPLVRPALLVPEGIHLDDLVEQFRAHQTKIAVVVDEHGATGGIVTFKDIVEEIFGNLRSAPGRPDEWVLRRLADGRVIARGDMRLDELGRELGWVIEDEDVATIAGLVMKKLGRVAQVGDTVSVLWGSITVEEMKKLRITHVSLKSAADAAKEKLNPS